MVGRYSLAHSQALVKGLLGPLNANASHSHLGTLAGARVPAARARVKHYFSLFCLHLPGVCARKTSILIPLILI